ncbi:ClpXP protease specificity-enhancing factor SspB [Bosea sp. (in: a-proteobacteria)]|uniref:SspB family protein n=1 Tax=Bosea sp. (in: a-proteobacteria) TaxID=1871050 RepID=UPI003341C169
MSKDVLRYDLMVQEALKGVVRKILSEAARDGLPGEHHFYVTFRTGAPGVRLSQRLREKHPEEMTIVLQHQFWDLSVSEHAFEVGLSFSGVPERLLVPFDAVTTFFDPSVQFGLKFETQDAPEEAAAPEPETADAPTPLPAKLAPAGVPAVKSKAAGAEEVGGDDEEAQASDSEGDGRGSAEVVSLDSFRKKT